MSAAAGKLNPVETGRGGWQKGHRSPYFKSLCSITIAGF